MATPNSPSSTHHDGLPPGSMVHAPVVVEPWDSGHNKRLNQAVRVKANARIPVNDPRLRGLACFACFAAREYEVASSEL